MACNWTTDSKLGGEIVRKRGFTLVEIVVAIGVLGVLSLGTATVLGNNFSFLNTSRDITGDTFLSQQAIELEISDIKTQLRDSSHGLTLNSVIIDGVSVYFYEVSKTYNNTVYKYRVTPQQYPEYILLKTFDVDADIKSNSIETYSVYPIATSSIAGENTPDPSTYSTHWMMDIHQWYVSAPGFNVPVPKGPVNDTSFKYYDYLVDEGLETEIGTRYPVFPDDYILIGTATTNMLSDVTQYAGKHIVYKVTPAAKSGRLGIPEYSDPVFVNRLKNTANLSLHLDASMIDPSYRDSASVSHVDSTGRVATWLDLSSGIGVSTPSEKAVQTTSSSRPMLMDTDVSAEFKGRYVKFESGKTMTISNQNTSGKWLYVYAIVRGSEGSIIFKNGSEEIAIDTTAQDIDNGWLLQKATFPSGSNSFVIGGDDVDIAELIVYGFNATLSTADETNLVDEINEIIYEKFVPLDASAPINYLLPLSDVTVYQNESYTAPGSIPAMLLNGLNKYVAVTWPNSGVVDTSTIGTITLTGKATDDETKTITLKVNVIAKPLVETIVLTPNVLNLKVGESETIIATVSPEEAVDKSINWTSSDDNIATVADGVVTAEANGTATITAASNDGNASTDLVVTVTSALSTYDWPSGMVLQLDASLAFEAVDGSPVSVWNNRANSYNDFSPTASGREPIYKKDSLNGFYTVEFDGTKSMIYSDSKLDDDGEDEDFYSSTGNTFSVFVVGRSTSTNSERTFLSKAGGWAGSATYAIGTSSGNFAQKLRGQTISTSGDKFYNIHSAIWNGSKSEYYLNGIEKYSLDRGESNTNQTNPVAIGASKGGTAQYLIGNIAEIIVFNRNLDENDRKDVENYLRLKWFADPEKAWYFSNNVDGWSAVSNIPSFTHANTGTVGGPINGSDPHIVSGDNLNVDITNQKLLMIRLKNETSSNQGQIYFTTTSETGFDEAKHVDFSILPNSDYTDYIINMDANPKWTGTLKQLRIDPAVNATGTFNIDFIRIVN